MMEDERQMLDVGTGPISCFVGPGALGFWMILKVNDEALYTESAFDSEEQATARLLECIAYLKECLDHADAALRKAKTEPEELPEYDTPPHWCSE